MQVHRLTNWLSTEREDMPEYLDADPPTADLAASLGDLRLINRFLGGLAVVRSELHRLIGRSRQPASVLDIATGSGDIPREIVEWGRRRHQWIDVTAVDSNARSIWLAKRLSKPGSNLRFLRADAFELPFANRSFDYAISSLTIHHFDNESAVVALREMARVARKGIIVNDLIRGRLPAALIWVITRIFRMNRMTQHDGPVSVMRARTVKEYRELFAKAGFADFHVYRHPFWRVAVVARLA